MLIHIMLGTLVLALACFVIGRLAGHPTLLGRKSTEPARRVEPAARIVLRPALRRGRMRIEP